MKSNVNAGLAALALRLAQMRMKSSALAWLDPASTTNLGCVKRMPDEELTDTSNGASREVAESFVR